MTVTWLVAALALTLANSSKSCLYSLFIIMAHYNIYRSIYTQSIIIMTSLSLMSKNKIKTQSNSHYELPILVSLSL